MDICQSDSEAAMHWLAQEEGIFSEASPCGAMVDLLTIRSEVASPTIIVIVCDRGARYLFTGVFDS